MRIGPPISATDRSQITNLSIDIQILKGRTTWRNLPSIFLIQHDFDYLPRFFSVSKPTAMVLMLYLPPAWMTIRKPERFQTRPRLQWSEYLDCYGNRCGRVFAPSGRVVFHRDRGTPLL